MGWGPKVKNKEHALHISIHHCFMTAGERHKQSQSLVAMVPHHDGLPLNCESK